MRRLRKALAPVVDKMCADCQRRAVTNPFRVFDCKVPEDQPIIATLPTIAHYLDDACRKPTTKQVKQILNADTRFRMSENPRLVRGLDYYHPHGVRIYPRRASARRTRFWAADATTVCPRRSADPPAPGIGFAIGEDRLVLSLPATAESVLRQPDVYVSLPSARARIAKPPDVARELRRHDLVVELGRRIVPPEKILRGRRQDRFTIHSHRRRE
jgi:histidyl-tRNA synthetase